MGSGRYKVELCGQDSFCAAERFASLSLLCAQFLEAGYSASILFWIDDETMVIQKEGEGGGNPSRGNTGLVGAAIYMAWAVV